MLRSHARASPAYGCAGFPKCAALINYHEWGMIEQGRANKGYLGGVDSSYPHMYSFILQVWYEAVRPKSRNGGIQWPGAHTFLECGYTPVLDWPQISTQRRGVEEPKVVSVSNARVYRQSWRGQSTPQYLPGSYSFQPPFTLQCFRGYEVAVFYPSDIASVQ